MTTADPRPPRGELAPELLRRVLVTTAFEYSGEVFWRHDDGVLTLYADCSDMFAWACADCEPIESASDVELLERCLADLRAVTGETYPMWLTELYAARRRGRRPAEWFLTPGGRYDVGDGTRPLFLLIGHDSGGGEVIG